MMPAVCPDIAAALPQACTRVGNGSALLAGIDGRSAGARRYREHVSELELEIGQLKRRLNTTEKLLVRRAALIAMWCENIEAEMASGSPIEITPYTTASNTLRRLLLDLQLLSAK